MLETEWLLASGSMSGSFLAMIAQTAQETVPAAEGWRAVLAVVTDIAIVIIALSLMFTVLALAAIAWYARKMVGKVGGLVGKVQQGVDPVLKHARDVGDNVNYISTSVRVDVQQLNQTIANANQRVNEAVSFAEKRIHALNGLLEVVQEEAEEIFIGTASAVRGARAGASRLREPRPPAEHSRIDTREKAPESNSPLP